MELESVPYNIRNEVDNVFYLFDDKAQPKSIEMSMLVHDTVPTCIVGDPGRFRQVYAFLYTRKTQYWLSRLLQILSTWGLDGVEHRRVLSKWVFFVPTSKDLL